MTIVPDRCRRSPSRFSAAVFVGGIARADDTTNAMKPANAMPTTHEAGGGCHETGNRCDEAGGPDGHQLDEARRRCNEARGRIAMKAGGCYGSCELGSIPAAQMACDLRSHRM